MKKLSLFSAARFNVLLLMLIGTLVFCLGCAGWLARKDKKDSSAEKAATSDPANQAKNGSNKAIACNDTLELKDIMRPGIMPTKSGAFYQYEFDTAKVLRIAPDFNAQNLLGCYRHLIPYSLKASLKLSSPQRISPQENRYEILATINGRMIANTGGHSIHGAIYEANGVIRLLYITDYSTDISPQPLLSKEEALKIACACKGCNTLITSRSFWGPCKQSEIWWEGEPVYLAFDLSVTPNTHITNLAYKAGVIDQRGMSWLIFLDANTGKILQTMPM